MTEHCLDPGPPLVHVAEVGWHSGCLSLVWSCSPCSLPGFSSESGESPWPPKKSNIVGNRSTASTSTPSILDNKLSISSTALLAWSTAGSSGEATLPRVRSSLALAKAILVQAGDDHAARLLDEIRRVGRSTFAHRTCEIHSSRISTISRRAWIGSVVLSAQTAAVPAVSAQAINTPAQISFNLVRNIVSSTSSARLATPTETTRSPVASPRETRPGASSSPWVTKPLHRPARSRFREHENCGAVRPQQY